MTPILYNKFKRSLTPIIKQE